MAYVQWAFFCLDVRLTFGLFFQLYKRPSYFQTIRAQLFNDNWQFVIGVGNVVAMPITCHMNVMFENSLAPHVRFSGADDIFLENCNNAGTDVVFVTRVRSRARVRYLWAT